MAGSPLVDGVAPAIIEPIAVQDVTSRQNEPQVDALRSDPRYCAGFGAIRTGRQTGLARGLPARRVYLNGTRPNELTPRAGRPHRACSRGRTSRRCGSQAIVRFDGAGTDGAAVMMPLAAAQQLLGQPGQ